MRRLCRDSVRLIRLRTYPQGLCFQVGVLSLEVGSSKTSSCAIFFLFIRLSGNYHLCGWGDRVIYRSSVCCAWVTPESIQNFQRNAAARSERLAILSMTPQVLPRTRNLSSSSRALQILSCVLVLPYLYNCFLRHCMRVAINDTAHLLRHFEGVHCQRYEMVRIAADPMVRYPDRSAISRKLPILSFTLQCLLKLGILQATQLFVFPLA